MFAVIKTGGKQYRVEPDDVLTVERLDGEPGAIVTFGEVLMVGTGEAITIGAPTIAGASVAAELVEQTRGRKVIAFKKRRRHNSRRRRGHRQDLTVVRITDILGVDGVTRPKAKAAPRKKAEAAADAGGAAAAADTAPAPKTAKPAKKAPKPAARSVAKSKAARPARAAAKPKAAAKKAPAKAE